MTATQQQEALTEVYRNLKNVQGSWSYQVLNNIDEVLGILKGKLDDADYRKIEMFIETGIKHPIRRQIGRVSAAISKLDGID